VTLQPWAPLPGCGRVFTAARIVRSSEVTPAGRLRFDALARYLQDVAEDDLADAGWREPVGRVVRRVALIVRGYPAHGQWLRLSTFCSATGPRRAERTTTVAGSGRDLIQASAVWAAVAQADGSAVPLGSAFHRLYGPSAQGRTVSARLSHPGPPPSLARRAWPLRASDFDPVGHVNNAIHWAAIEDILAGLDWLPAAAELEFRRPSCLVTSRSW
jgi:acyl-ACP thioesterase